jgi:uncharacterized membrane protein
MTKIFTYFLRGLVVVVPLAITIYVCYAVFTRIDGWLGFAIPGVGFVVTIALITLTGFLASNLITRGLLSAFDSLMERLPFVRLLYSSTKDLLNAFVGEKRRFDRPVLVRLSPESEARLVGFVTQSSLAQLGLDGYVAVYLPQAYAVHGNLAVCPAGLVEPLHAVSSEVLAFIVSGGVTDIPTMKAEA